MFSGCEEGFRKRDCDLLFIELVEMLAMPSLVE